MRRNFAETHRLAILTVALALVGQTPWFAAGLRPGTGQGAGPQTGGAAPPTPPAAKPGITLHATTTLVQVHVIAHDSKGRAVTDLKKDDFEILDNGVKQKIAIFSADTAAPAQKTAAPTAFPDDTAVDTPGAKTGYAAILVDFRFFKGLPGRTFPDIASMLKRAELLGKAGLFYFDGWSVKTVADFGADRQTLLTRLKSIPFESGPGCQTRMSCAWLNQTLLLQELEAMADKLSFLPGRKALIWLSRGYDLQIAINSAQVFTFGPLPPNLLASTASKADPAAVPESASADAGLVSADPAPELVGDTPKLAGEIQRVIQKLNNADTAVYAVDVSGLPPWPEPQNPFIPALENYAEQTGGKAFYNRNDFDVCIEQSADAVRSVYSLGFYPDSAGDASEFHRLQVNVTRPGVTLSYRQGYSLAKPGAMPDAELAKDVPGAEARALALAKALPPALQELRILARAPMESSPGAAMTLPFFYTGANVAIVDSALEIGVEHLKFKEVDGRRRAELNFAAAARRPDGAVAAQFADTVKLDFATEAEATAFLKRPYRYEHQFRLAPGKYEVRVAYGSGDGSLGSVNAPVTVEGWDGKSLAVSGVALARETRKSDATAAALEARKALVSRGTEIIPAGNVGFQRGEPCKAYFEIYDPSRGAANTQKLSAQLRVLDAATGEQKVDSGAFPVDGLARPGEQTIPVSLSVPVDGLAPGKYKLEVKAIRAGGETVTRLAEFEVE